MGWGILLTIISILLGLITIIGVGITIGMVRSLYLTKEEHERICGKNTSETQRQLDELKDNRQEVWKKIDRIYEWMVTGVVEINKGMK